MLAVERGRWVVTGSLDTPRLTLRAHRHDDLDDLVQFHSDAKITRYIPWPVRDRQQTAAALSKKLEQVAAEVGGWLTLAVELRETRQVIGEALLKRGEDHAEIGYVVASAFQGAGYAGEAVEALLSETRTALAVDRFTAVVDERNDASLRLLGRLDFVLVEKPAAGGEGLPLQLVLIRS